ncbi:aldolase/citrate lyase family protein [Streptomyces sp. NPDC008092]|uniref:HpcH/HpaI aldolase/citrate lyase family protein n=1 Tax=Streptomyces sp. NPDC008092 TaxID=3364808 RepID=UPI0036ECC932
MARHDIEAARTFLFVPATRPDRFDKAVGSGADVVIIDLEDAVAPDQKAGARANVEKWLASGGRAAVRVNGRNTVWFGDDLAVAARATAVVVAKAESAADVAAVGARYGSGLPVVPLVETPRGLYASREICETAGVVRVAFGNVDFAAETGVDPASHTALSAARSHLVYASAAAGCAPPIDGVTTSVKDPEALSADTRHARELGFTAKLLIHPSQVGAVAELLSPSPQEIRWARDLLASSTGGVGTHDGHMIDEPVLRRARQIAARAASGGAVPDQT